MSKNLPEELDHILRSLSGLECWYVSCGGAAGSTFQLVLGEKIRRSVPLKNLEHLEDFRQFEGEVGLFVWCAWRLDSPVEPVSSWDDTQESIETCLKTLIGTRIRSIEVFPPAWDATIRFSNTFCLRIFCDHVCGAPSFDGNWDLRRKNKIISLGPGSMYRTETRPYAER
jgi:hypothetical protein